LQGFRERRAGVTPHVTRGPPRGPAGNPAGPGRLAQREQPAEKSQRAPSTGHERPTGNPPVRTSSLRRLTARLFFHRDEPIHVLLQHIERDRTDRKHGVVKLADVELRAELPTRPL